MGEPSLYKVAFAIKMAAVTHEMERAKKLLLSDNVAHMGNGPGNRM
jgi:hypothetical protein